MILVQGSNQRRKRNDLLHCPLPETSAHLSEETERIPHITIDTEGGEDQEVQIHVPRVEVGMIRRIVESIMGKRE